MTRADIDREVRTARMRVYLKRRLRRAGLPVANDASTAALLQAYSWLRRVQA